MSHVRPPSNVAAKGKVTLATASPSVQPDVIDIGHLDGLVGYHVRRAFAVIGNDFARALAETGIRQVLFGILSIVGANPGINQGAVGRALGIQRANMVSLINELVDRGLIDRITAEDDRRAFALTLTADGEAIAADCLRRIREHENGLLIDFSPDERETLISLIRRIEARGA